MVECSSLLRLEGRLKWKPVVLEATCNFGFSLLLLIRITGFSAAVTSEFLRTIRPPSLLDVADSEKSLSSDGRTLEKSFAVAAVPSLSCCSFLSSLPTLYNTSLLDFLRSTFLRKSFFGVIS